MTKNAKTVRTSRAKNVNTVDAVASFHSTLLAAFDARADYERAKNAENDSMQATLKDLRASVAHARIAEIMHAANVDANFINRSERVNARFNVYSADKVINIARCIAKVETLNHYSRAILKSAIALEKQDMLLQHRDAESACTLSIKIDASREKHLVKYQKHVSVKTASTQSSSSINALQMYNVLIESRDAANVVCYRVNHENETTKALLASL